MFGIRGAFTSLLVCSQGLRENNCRRVSLVAIGSFLAATTTVSPATAQRASENVLTAATDAFGSSVGNESTGLYSSNSARGFSPITAGNARIEGMYFDPGAVGLPTGRLMRGNTIRVGIASQSYPFAAPTGIVDVELRRPGARTIVSTNTSYGPYNSNSFQVDSQIPLIAGKLGLAAGAEKTYFSPDDRGMVPSISFSSLLQWNVTDNFRISPFWNYYRQVNAHPGPYIVGDGNSVPPRYDRYNWVPQPWALRDQRNTIYGVLATAAPWTDWSTRLGLFRVIRFEPRTLVPLFRNTRSDGRTNFSFQSEPVRSATATSGEFRVSHALATGPLRQNFSFAVRGRDTYREFGGGDLEVFGETTLGERFIVPEPTFQYGPLSFDKVRQGFVGLNYQANWPGVGEASFGIQKTSYRRSVELPGLPVQTNKTSPWLYNGTLAINLASNATLFGSYSRGLEESGVAPERALNRGQPLQATLTEQKDIGIRYAIVPNVTFVTSIFEISKPFFDVEPSSLVFRRVGNLRHRGVEASLSGNFGDGFTVLVGGLLLQAEMSGELVDLGLFGTRPLGTMPRNVTANVQYAPRRWRGFAVDAQLGNNGKQYANQLNTLRLPGRTLIDLGARYQFTAYGVPGMLRARLFNLTDRRDWRIDGSGRFMPQGERRVSLTLTLDISSSAFAQ